ncbi:MAG: iron-sulfur cluster assembly scaffold protein [Woeseiaceae bacterium]|jgi:NifU-like protein involved in Fe-S cluster formation
MNDDPYSELVRDLFAQPAHAGAIDGAVTAHVDDQGVRIRLYAELEGGIVSKLRFQAWACPHVIAAAEAFCADFEGRPAADLLEFSSSDLMKSLAVPVEKTGRILVLEDAVRSLGNAACGASKPDTEED